MNLNQETLLNKSIGDVIKLCLKLNEKNEELRKQIMSLKQDKASKDVKDTNRDLRIENRRLRTQIKNISKTLGIKVDEIESDEKE